jgi:hypothetical protein
MGISVDMLNKKPARSSPKKKRDRKRKSSSDAATALPISPSTSTTTTCHSLSDVEAIFKSLWANNQDTLIPECLSINFTISQYATFLVKDLTPDVRSAYGMPVDDENLGAIEVDVPAAVLPVSDTMLKRKRQRVAANEILRLIGGVDGYHYGLSSASDPQGDGFRFRFVCADSWENKDRAANKKRRKEAKEEPVAEERVTDAAERDCGWLQHYQAA